jgi:hypothetical protein
MIVRLKQIDYVYTPFAFTIIYIPFHLLEKDLTNITK